MPQKRGVARRSFARRRVRRVKKWDHTTVPLQFKKYLPYMAPLLEEEMPPPVECEEPTMAELQIKGVPESEWPHYLGYMKRMLECYRHFTDATLQSEKDSLIAEYVLRGKDKDVLQQIQTVVEVCAGVALSCDQVKACLEGDYSSYSVYDRFCDADLSGSRFEDSGKGTADETKIVIFDNINGNLGVLKVYDIATKTLGAALMNQIYLQGAFPMHLLNSVRGKYVLMLKWTDVPNALDELRIFKDGALLQTLTDAQLGFYTNNIYGCFITTGGKYIGVCGFLLPAYGDCAGWTILEGN